jgi:predicted secreted protein
MGEVRVSAQDSDVHVSLGDEVVVQLPENATTGYLWSVQRVDAGLEVTGNEYEAPGSPLPGAGGKRVVRLRPTAAGEGLVQLVLKRPWESSVQERLSVRISVSG